MKSTSIILIRRWFDCLNRGDLNSLLELFAESPTIRNAANPPLSGPCAARKLLEEFFERTSSRRFDVIDAAEGDGQVFACWDGELTFRSGITIADVVLASPLRVRLRGVERFRVDNAGKITEVDIIHETTSIPRAAREARQDTRKGATA